MKTAIVTGASKGIGLAVSKVLVNMSYKVFGIGRDFNETDFSDDNFIKVQLDITKTEELVSCIKQIKKNENVYVLVNNAGVGFFGLHEEINYKNISQMVRTNFEAPLILSNLLLRDLKKNRGFIINISSAAAKKSATHGCAYGASKAGLTHFAGSLFDEARKYGVKVVTIHPDMTKSEFYRNANFRESDDCNAHILAEEVADFVKLTLEQREGIVVTDITIKPQKNIIYKK